MSYLIVIVILFMILAPIISILPSKRQKQQMAFRQQARAAGVSVALAKIEDPDSDRDKYLSATGRPLPRDLACVAYRRPRKRKDNRDGMPVPGTPMPGWALVRDKSVADQLSWVEADSKNIDPVFRNLVEARVTDLPADIVRIDETAELVSVYWHERSDEQGLTSLLNFLKEVVTLSPCLQTNSSVDEDPEGS